jgi:iron complex transport system substrate-binding protein
MTRHPLPRAWSALALVVTAGVLLSGCAGTTTPGDGAQAAVTPTPTPTGAYPLSIKNCDTTVTVQKPPTRIVTIKSSATEMLLALGLGDHIVGTAFLDGPLPQSLSSIGANLKVISDFLPSQEAALALNPDFVYGGWESNFAADGVGERSALATLGIGSYVSPSACKGAAQPNPLTFDTVFGEITEAGALFGAPDAAARLVATQRKELTTLAPAKTTTTALWYSSGVDSPYVGAGIGAPQMIMDAAGLTNVFASVKDTWTSVGWESVVAADPSVIVLVDATWNTAKSKIATLEANPATKELSAVKNKRYVTLPFAATEAGIRNVEAAATTIDQVADLNSLSK